MAVVAGAAMAWYTSRRMPLARSRHYPGLSLVVKEDYLNAQMEMVFGKLHGYTGVTGVDVNDLADMGLTASQGTTEMVKGTAIVGSSISQNFYDPNMRPNDPPPEPPAVDGRNGAICPDQVHK